VLPNHIGQTPSTSTRTLLKLEHPPLWTWTTKSPKPLTLLPPDSDSCIVDLPFHFTLPPSLPPSFSESCRTDSTSSGSGLSVRIQYWLVVKAERHGILRCPRRTECALVILGGSDSDHLRALSLPLPSIWRSFTSTLLLPLPSGSTFGYVELDLPDAPLYPTDLRIPFRCRVTIISPSNFNDAVTSSASTSTTPTPTPRHGSLTLERRLTVDAGTPEQAYSTTRKPVGSIPYFQISHIPHNITTTTTSTSNKQEVYTFSGYLTLSGIPSFQTSNNDIRMSHRLCLELATSGLDKLLTASWEIVLCSGIEAPPPSFEMAATASPSYADPHLPSYHV
jgi:hypothetical protein